MQNLLAQWMLMTSHRLMKAPSNFHCTHVNLLGKLATPLYQSAISALVASGVERAGLSSLNEVRTAKMRIEMAPAEESDAETIRRGA